MPSVFSCCAAFICSSVGICTVLFCVYQASSPLVARPPPFLKWKEIPKDLNSSMISERSFPPFTHRAPPLLRLSIICAFNSCSLRKTERIGSCFFSAFSVALIGMVSGSALLSSASFPAIASSSSAITSAAWASNSVFSLDTSFSFAFFSALPASSSASTASCRF